MNADEPRFGPKRTDFAPPVNFLFVYIKALCDVYSRVRIVSLDINSVCYTNRKLRGVFVCGIWFLQMALDKIILGLIKTIVLPV